MTTVRQLTLMRREAERLGLAESDRPTFYARLLDLRSLDSVRDLSPAVADELIQRLAQLPAAEHPGLALT